MRLALVDDTPSGGLLTRSFADADGDGLDDDTGLPVATDDQDGDGEPEDDYPEGSMAPGEHRWLLLREGVSTGDGRTIEPGVTEWRDLPLPFMAIDRTTDAHDDARIVANIVDIERDGDDIYATTRHIESTDPVVLQLQALIDQGDLRGVSVDLDNIEGNLILEMPDDMEPEIEEGADVAETIVIPFGGDTERLEVTACRIMGATAVPFPAFAEAQMIAAAPLVAALESTHMTVLTEQTLTAAAHIAPPVHPPAEWFGDPGLDGPTPITVTAEGRLFGHIAVWNSCHRGFADRCVTPPRAPNGDYSQYHTGTLVAENGERIAVGALTVDSGHADISVPGRLAKQHYDDTGWVGADLCVGEDAHGIYAAGAVRPDLDALAIRKLMAADVSGDWRAFDGKGLRLVGLASVPVPGFVKTGYADGLVAALVASVPVCSDEPAPDNSYRMVAERIAASIRRTPEHRLAERDAVAFKAGRHPSQRKAAIAARIGRRR